MDEETKTLIKKHYNTFLNQYDSSEEFNYKFPEQSNGFFLGNIIGYYEYLKEHLGLIYWLKMQIKSWIIRVINYEVFIFYRTKFYLNL